MSKMSEDIFECFRAGIKDAEGSHTYAHDTVSAIFNEAERARRVESEQAEQLRQKDETIRELADALEKARELLPNSFASASRIIIDAALAKAGRKP